MINIKELLQKQEAYIIEMRRWFHRHPELSMKEEKTSLKIQEELGKMGVPYEVLSPGFCVVAEICGQKPSDKKGKTIAIRADIDALAVKEETGLEFSSEQEGLMHACGHDAHAAMLLGAAKALNEVKEHFSGKVLCVFQCGEEIGLGYAEPLEYLKARGGVGGVIGLHIWSAVPEGEILLLPGAIFAGGNWFKVKVHGQGGHGARPDLVNDPIKTACELVLKFASIPSNFYDVLDHSVVSTGMIHAGTLYNIFPSEAEFEGSCRWYKPDGGKELRHHMERIADGICRANNVDYEISFNEGFPPIINNPVMIERARKLVDNVEGLRLSPQTNPICAGDNYAHFLEQYKGFYGVLGAGKKGCQIFPQHHCQFDIDEQAFRKGAEFMVSFALDFLKGGE